MVELNIEQYIRKQRMRESTSKVLRILRHGPRFSSVKTQQIRHLLQHIKIHDRISMHLALLLCSPSRPTLPHRDITRIHRPSIKTLISCIKNEEVRSKHGCTSRQRPLLLDLLHKSAHSPSSQTAITR